MAPHLPHLPNRPFLSCKSKALRPEPTREDSGSTTGSETTFSSSPSTKSSKFSFTKLSLHDHVRRGSQDDSSTNSRRQSQDDTGSYTLPQHSDPISLCEAAAHLALAVPGPPLDVLRKDLMPQLYWENGYALRVNTRENLNGVDELMEVAKRFRERFMVRLSTPSRAALLSVAFPTSPFPQLPSLSFSAIAFFPAFLTKHLLSQTVRLKFRTHLMDMDGTA
jgi:hypothetical protein